ncbi:uncharacterized protein LOC131695003 [Topomyia yanbarensis]|uniref:uncharacterized protein LOC131695003 n=1 Tax=Topomyia yanbarensis TaxID=2498891 RepID=UPI00273C2E9B|nr:uncharacterized protein LOC131695003 [Topomyia yanbarensis]
MPSVDLRQLLKQERQVKLSLENVQEFVDNYQEERDKGMEELRLKQLKNVLLGKCTQRAGIIADRQPIVAGSVQPSRTKYPELKLPTFSGKLQEWINFRDNFKSLIHDNGDLSTIDKFNYLRASLKDEALLQINQVQVTAATYNIAWTILEAKYENHKLIAQEHLKALFMVPAMKSESFEALNAILMTFKINLQQLEKLGERTDNWSTILAFMMSQKLDNDTLRHWETHHSSKDIPKYSALVEFLENHCSILLSTSSRRGIEYKRPFKAPAVHTAITATSNCSICNGGSHSLEQCRRFNKMRVIDRNMAIRRLGLCLNYLLSGHFVAECTRNPCGKCGQRHHHLLHPFVPSQLGGAPNTNQNQAQNNPRRPQAANSQHQSQLQSHTNAQSRTNNSQVNPQQTPVQNTVSQPTRQPPPTPTSATSLHTATLHNTVHRRNTTLLSTAIIKLGDRSGNTIIARALLDNGSQICMITENLSKKLNFKRLRENLPVKGVGSSLTISKQSILAKVLSRCSSYETAELKFFVVPQITLNLPQRSFDISSWKVPAEIQLADPKFFVSNTVDVILGVAIFYDLLLNELLQLLDEGPILRNTELGWIVAGEISDDPTTTFSATVATSITTEEVYEQLSRFWELESCRTKSCLSIEESACESFLSRRHHEIRTEDLE